MPRVTRSAAAVSRTQDLRLDNAADLPAAEDVGEVSGSDQLSPEGYMKRALRGIKTVRNELDSLRKHNAAIQKRLEELEEGPGDSGKRAHSTRARPTVTQLLQQVRSLKDEVKKLQKERSQDKKKIEKLKLKEIKEDAADLQEASFEVGDTAYRMRKLLRRFHDLMLSTSLDQEEECPICMDPLESRNCVSLPCDHTFCNGCMAQVAKDLELVRCPQCRSEYHREEIETVEYTALQQWDELLKVATAWAKMDRRREDDTSEEEADEEFIDDPQAATSASESSAHQNAPQTSPEPDEALDPPDPVGDLTSEDVPRTPVRKRRAVVLESSPEPEGDDTGTGTASLSVLALAAADNAAPSAAELPLTPNGQVLSPAITYAQSPKAEKRQRMEELAALRSAKKSRVF